MKKATSLLTCLNFPLAIGTTVAGSFAPILSKEGNLKFPFKPQRFFLFSNEKGEVNHLFKTYKGKRYLDEGKLGSALIKIVREKLGNQGEKKTGRIYYKISEDERIETVILWGNLNYFFDYFNFHLK